MQSPPRFLVDLGSPFAYLAAERIDDVLGEATWEVVLLGGLFQSTGRRSWADTAARAAGQAEVERRAAARGLPPVRWPQHWPNNGLLAARAAVWARTVDAERRFITEALRLQFRDGVGLDSADAVREVARRSGLSADEALAGATRPATKAALRERTAAAHAAGVFGVPSVIVAQFVLWGDDALEQAAVLAGRR